LREMKVAARTSGNERMDIITALATLESGG
jgi:hypothetical protein